MNILKIGVKVKTGKVRAREQCYVVLNKRRLRTVSLRSSLLVMPPSQQCIILVNRLLTEREGRTGEYSPEVVAVRTELSEVRTATTEGQNSSVRPEQARLVSCLLYGTLFLIV